MTTHQPPKRAHQALALAALLSGVIGCVPASESANAQAGQAGNLDNQDTTAPVFAPGEGGVVSLGRMTPQPGQSIDVPFTSLPVGNYLYVADVLNEGMTGQTCEFRPLYKIDRDPWGIDIDAMKAQVGSTTETALAELPQNCPNGVCSITDLDLGNAVPAYSLITTLGEPPVRWLWLENERCVRVVVRPTGAVLKGAITFRMECALE